MKDPIDMDFEELRQWEADAWAAARAKFAGTPRPPRPRGKFDEYENFVYRPTVWGFSLIPGMPVLVWPGTDPRRRDSAADATIVRLAAVADGGPLALLVRLTDGSVRALRRHDGNAVWAERVATRMTSADVPRLPVDAWQVADPDSPTIAAPSDLDRWHAQGFVMDEQHRPVEHDPAHMPDDVTGEQCRDERTDG